jgi:predicted ArsR family transcriptional regulator
LYFLTKWRIFNQAQGMKGTKFGQNFFESTRGRVLELIRQGVNTVEGLSNRLELTDNAVRAHLSTLERDRLIEQHGLQRGLRKPHFSYRLSPDAEQLFPKAYHALLSRLLTVLKLRLEPEQFQQILSEVANTLAAGLADDRESDTLESKAENAMEVLAELGGTSRIENEGEKILIRSNGGCPFSEVVTEHPEICRLAETLLSEITGAEVCERCERGDSPRCTFEIRSAPEPVDAKIDNPS